MPLPLCAMPPFSRISLLSPCLSSLSLPVYRYIIAPYLSEHRRSTDVEKDRNEGPEGRVQVQCNTRSTVVVDVMSVAA